ncbi:MAG: acetate--CoA ligase family protein [Oscillospiraceae bacterium]|nr:acetate--CoA ligase family protein [Oscillospiraceae bacterium]
MTGKEKLDRLIQPKSVAILGCSEFNIGGRVLQNLIKSTQFQGAIYPVSLKQESICGVKCYQTLADIPGPVDCCVIALRSTLIPDALAEVRDKGVHAVVMFASGFSEVGAEGKALQAVVAQKLKEYDITSCGPNCIGLYNTEQGVYLWGDPYKLENRPGPVGVVAHSGAVSIVLSNAGRDLGYSKVISCGNEAGTPVAEYIRYLADDPQTEVIACFLETIREPAGFRAAAHYALSKNKPIIALQVGRSETGKKTAAAHSGALASSSAVTEAYFKTCGVLTVKSIDELLETCALLVMCKDKLPTTQAIGITAISGGLLSLSSDNASDEHVALAEINEETRSALAEVLPVFSTPHNPLDVSIALFDPPAYRRCIEIMAQDPAVGMILVCQECEQALLEEQDYIYWDIVKTVAELKLDKPLAVYSPLSGGLHPSMKRILDAACVPLLQGMQETMRAVALLMEYAKFRRGAVWAQTTQPRQPKLLAEFPDSGVLSEGESKALLRAYDIPVAKEALVQSVEEAVSSAEAIGYPVVMKIDSPDIRHKTEAGVVRLNVSSSEQVQTVYEELLANAKAYDPNALIRGISIQEMVTGGTEIILGMKNDANFGPSVMVGLGGIFVEIFQDVALRLAPVSREAAYEMIGSLKGKPVLEGARGRAKADLDALADTIVKFSQLAVDNAGTIGEMDINPVLVLEAGKGVRAVDALAVKKQ